MLMTAQAVRPIYDPPQYRTWIVPESLDDLHGPASGILTLGIDLYWNGGSSEFPLSNDDAAQTAYEIVLREAATDEQLNDLINRHLLIRYWSTLRIPPRMRNLWESVHPELAQ